MLDTDLHCFVQQRGLHNRVQPVEIYLHFI